MSPQTLTTNNILDRLKNQTYCRVKPSKTHGVGVFASKDIPSGIAPWSTPNHHFFGGTVRVTTNELNKLDEPVRQMLLDYNLLTDRGLFIHPCELEVLHITQFLNASTDPNEELRDREEIFKTIREIKAGEELTVDYQKDLKDTDCKYNYKY